MFPKINEASGVLCFGFDSGLRPHATLHRRTNRRVLQKEARTMNLWSVVSDIESRPDRSLESGSSHDGIPPDVRSVDALRTGR